MNIELDPPHPRAVHWLSGGCARCKVELGERYIVNYARPAVICALHKRHVKRPVRRMRLPQ